MNEDEILQNPSTETSSTNDAAGVGGGDILEQDIGDALESVLAEGQMALAKQEEMRMANLPYEYLTAIGTKVKDKSNEIYEALIDKKGRKAISLILAQEVVRVCIGIINVQDFYEKNRSQQTVFIYVGTHFETLNTQLFHDYLKLWAEKMGLMDNLLTDDSFMMNYYTRTLFMLKKKHTTIITKQAQSTINLMNGTLVVDEDGNPTLREHSQEDFFQYVLPYCYDPKATCPLFEKFLSEVLPNEDVRRVVQEFFGYIFIKNLRLEKLLLLFGPGGNGKSVLLDIMYALFGSKNVSSVMLSDLDNDQKRAAMEGKFVNISFETGKRFHAEMVKTMATGEPVMAKHLYKDPFMMTEYGKLVASFNTMPAPENTWAFFRRLLKIDFFVTIPKEKVDKKLSAKICSTELPGVLNWALEGLKRLVENGDFSDSETIDKSLELYKLQADPFKLFTMACCKEAEAATTRGSEIYAKYQAFYYAEKFDMRKILGRTNFYERLREQYKWEERQHVFYFAINLMDYE